MNNRFKRINDLSALDATAEFLNAAARLNGAGDDSGPTIRN